MHEVQRRERTYEHLRGQELSAGRDLFGTRELLARAHNPGTYLALRTGSENFNRYTAGGTRFSSETASEQLSGLKSVSITRSPGTA